MTYVIDFAKKMVRKANIPILVYLLLNVLFIMALLLIMGVPNAGIAVLWALILYAISATLALSPFGEFLLRRQAGCRTIKDEGVLARIMPIFQEVLNEAQAADPQIPPNVRLYMNEETEQNAFATGRKTVCITAGLQVLPDDQLRAAFAHEIGHLAHHDTDLILLISVGNFFISAWFVAIQAIATIFSVIFGIIGIFAGGVDGVVTAIGSAIAHAVIATGCSFIMWIWTKLGVLLVMKSSRENEFEADGFATQLGHGQALCDFLKQPYIPAPNGLFANLQSSHPESAQRIVRIRSAMDAVATASAQER